MIILCRSWGRRIVREDIFSGLKYVAYRPRVVYSQVCRAMRESRRGKWEGPRFESLEERVGEWPRTAGSGHRLAGALPSPRRVCVDGMFKLRGLPCVLIVLSCVGLLAVRSLAPAEAQEVPYLGGAACVQYGECGGGGGTDPGPPLLVSASAS